MPSRLGELISAQKEMVGLNAGARGIGKSGVPSKHPTLSDAGIDKKLSSRAQKLASVPEYQFEGMLGEWRERGTLFLTVGIDLFAASKILHNAANGTVDTAKDVAERNT